MNMKPFALPRTRSIEMMATTISTNLNCNLACKHCYIQPDLLRKKDYIDEATFRRCVEVIKEAFDLDPSVTYLHLDVLGGEATLMPYEFWERNLPWVLDQVDEFNRSGVETEFTFCSNLMWRDERYLGLLREFKGHPHMDIAVPFEGPDSNRFGRNMAILPKFFERIEALGECNMLNLVLVMGQGIIDLGPEYIIEQFVKRGVTDVTCDMIFPWGSGREYFKSYQPMYADVARFIKELATIGKPYGLTVDHLDDMNKSLRTLSRSQNTLNDAYEYHWDHRGELTLNPNQTGTEAVEPFINLNVWDKNAALKVIWGNNSELDNKLSFEHDFCRDCAYLQACNSGWYPHKGLHPEVIARYMGEGSGAPSCPGFKELWAEQAKVSFDEDGVTRYANNRRLKRLTRAKAKAAGEVVLLDEELYATNYEGFFDAVKTATHVRVAEGNLFGCSVRQRLWFYDRLDLQPVFAEGLDRHDCEASIIAHSLAGNYHSLRISDKDIWSFVRRNPGHQLTLKIIDALTAVRTDRSVSRGQGFSILESGLEVSFKYEDLIFWALAADLPDDIERLVLATPQLTLTLNSAVFLDRITPSAMAFQRISRSLEAKA